MKSKEIFRLAILVSHPIHYQVFLYRRLSRHPRVDLNVYFCSDFGIKPRKIDPELGRSFNYGNAILEGYPHRFLKNFSPFPSLNHFWGLINLGVIKELYNEKYDAIWVHGWASVTTWLCFLYCWMARIPIMLRGEAVLLYPVSFWRRLTKKFFLSLLFKKVKVFLPIGRLNADFYRAYGVGEEQLFFVPYATDNEYFLNQDRVYRPYRNSIKESLGIPPEKVVILFVGKLVERKRPFDLLKAFERIGIEEKALVFVGEGNQRSNLEKYVQERSIKDVYFIGFRGQDEMSKFFSVADIFVLPSIYEPWGMVVNEAMNFGLSIIATDKVGAAYDLVRNGENGFMYPAGDIDKLAEHLTRLLQNSELRERMKKASSEIITKWSFKEDVEGILAALKYVRKHKRA
jgi:glycosyltransferase involved in cell wall biosynthesis